jgi:hypothetical protein
MTLDEAFQEYLGSPEFKDTAKRKDIPEGGRYRQYKARFKNGNLSKDIIIELLEANGYIITAENKEARADKKRFTKILKVEVKTISDGEPRLIQVHEVRPSKEEKTKKNKKAG